jgi:hypothetical protein
MVRKCSFLEDGGKSRCLPHLGRHREKTPCVACPQYTVSVFDHASVLLWSWYDTTLIFLEYTIVAMGCRSMSVDVAVMGGYRLYQGRSCSDSFEVHVDSCYTVVTSIQLTRTDLALSKGRFNLFMLVLAGEIWRFSSRMSLHVKLTWSKTSAKNAK